MIEIAYIEGAPGSNSEMKKLARRAVRFWNFRKKSRRLSTQELYTLNLATVRETPPEEVLRRMERVKQFSGR